MSSVAAPVTPGSVPKPENKPAVTPKSTLFKAGGVLGALGALAVVEKRFHPLDKVKDMLKKNPKPAAARK